jgi:hypothetical protein
MSGSKLLDWTPCMFNLSVSHVCFKTFGWNHTMFNLLVPWSTDKLNIVWFSPNFEPDMKYWQIELTGRFHPKVLNQTSWTYTVIPSKFWTRHEEQTSWIYRESPCMFNLSTSCLVQQFWIVSPCMFNLSVLHAWFKAFVLNHPVCSVCQYGDSIQMLCTRH